MKAELISFGFIIGGPEGATYVSSREEIEPKIAELSAAEQHDSDDYTATEVFAKGWTGIVIPEVLESTRPRNWDESFQSSLPTLSAVAPPCMALIGEAQIRAENEALTGCTWFRSAIPPGTPIYAASPAAPAQPEGGDALPDALMPVADEWYRLCERRFSVERMTISGQLAEAIVAAVCTRPAPAQQAVTGDERQKWQDWLEHAVKHWPEAETALLATASAMGPSADITEADIVWAEAALTSTAAKAAEGAK